MFVLNFKSLVHVEGTQVNKQWAKVASVFWVYQGKDCLILEQQDNLISAVVIKATLALDEGVRLVQCNLRHLSILVVYPETFQA